MHAMIETIRREAQHVVAARHFHGTLVATAYDPDTHSVKGILVPQEVETDWIPIAVTHSGNGFGIVVGPNVGSADKLDGDTFDIEFENGDRNTPKAKAKHFSADRKPPRVESGEIMVKHENGNKQVYAKDGSIVISHHAGSSVTFDAAGKVTINGGGAGNLT